MQIQKSAADLVVSFFSFTAVELVLILYHDVVCLCASDFQEVLKLEPGNKQALNELKKFHMVCFYVKTSCLCIYIYNVCLPNMS